MACSVSWGNVLYLNGYITVHVCQIFIELYTQKGWFLLCNYTLINLTLKTNKTERNEKLSKEGGEEVGWHSAEQAWSPETKKNSLQTLTSEVILRTTTCLCLCPQPQGEKQKDKILLLFFFSLCFFLFFSSVQSCFLCCHPFSWPFLLSKAVSSLLADSVLAAKSRGQNIWSLLDLTRTACSGDRTGSDPEGSVKESDYWSK